MYYASVYTYMRIYVGAIKEKHVLRERERGREREREREKDREKHPLFTIYNPVADYRSRIIALFLSCTDYSDISDECSSVLSGI